MYDLHDFLIPIDIHAINEDSGYNDGQFARHIYGYDSEMPDIGAIDIILLGIGETEGGAFSAMALRRPTRYAGSFTSCTIGIPTLTSPTLAM